MVTIQGAIGRTYTSKRRPDPSDLTPIDRVVLKARTKIGLDDARKEGRIGGPARGYCRRSAPRNPPSCSVAPETLSTNAADPRCRLVWSTFTSVTGGDV
jgi:hypothetical protein